MSGVLAAALAAAALLLTGPAEPTTAEDAVQQYGDAIVDDDWSRVWDLTCEEQRAGITKQAFVALNEGLAFQTAQDWLVGEVVPFTRVRAEAWRVDVTIVDRIYRADPFQELVIREDGLLRVCGDISSASERLPG